MALELGKNLHEYLGWDGPVTHRQHICWIEWRDFININQPSRDNYYQMQIACEQRRSVSKNPRSVKPDHFKIKFTKSKGTSSSQEGIEGQGQQKTPQQQRIDRIKQGWIARMTAPITVKQDGQVIETIEPPSVKNKRLREEAQRKARQNAIERKQQQLSNKPNSKQPPKPSFQHRDGRTIPQPRKTRLQDAPDTDNQNG